MDIFEFASRNNADYMDHHTGYIYCVIEYNRAKKFGLPTEGIRVKDHNGKLIGLVREEA